ncbi:MAG TPA: sensor domain-containing diguanylate cyclase, partial [Longimicrobiales bacterium]|nr:sensor domain-containing diguanylate cyclase [Longimicrobiales bacterium]
VPRREQGGRPTGGRGLALHRARLYLGAMPSFDPHAPGPDLKGRYRALLDIARALTGNLTIDELCRILYVETARILPTSSFHVSLYEEARDLATVVFSADRGRERRVNVTYRGSKSDVIRSGEPSVVLDPQVVRALPYLDGPDFDLLSSSASAPLRRHGRVVGSISIQSEAEEAYTAGDLELLQGLADMAAVAIENAHQVSELDRQRREAEQIAEIGRALSSSLDAEEVLGMVIQAVLALVRADGCSVWLLEGTDAQVAASGGRVAIPRGLRWELEGPLLEQLVRERVPVFIDDVVGSPLVPRVFRKHLTQGSGLSVPLVVGSQVAGALAAVSSQLQAFSEQDYRVLSRLASQVSVALENARLHGRLHSLSLTDSLTGLPNRRHLQMHLEREVAAARRGRDLMAIILDLDHFKRYNDTRGHLAGDEALKAFAEILRSENRAMNLVARYGGDEFVSVLSDTQRGGAEVYVERVRDKVADNEVLAEGEITVSAGMGAFDRATMKAPEDLLEAADGDLYRNKSLRKTHRT